MEKEIRLPSRTFESLVGQLVNLEDSLDNLLGEYFADDQSPPKLIWEKKGLKTAFDRYINELEQFIAGAEVVSEGKFDPPFVLIGTEVELEDLKTGHKQTFELVLPNRLEGSGYQLSCFSPLGKSLLLKRRGETVGFGFHNRSRHYRIESIRSKQL